MSTTESKTPIKSVDSIVTTPIDSKKPESPKKESKSHKSPKKKRKEGYLLKTWKELKLVNWPSLKYVVGWSLTIILFTSLVGSVLGFADYYFESGVKFIDCTSPTGSKNRTVDQCLAELTTELSFQRYFNRQSTNTSTPQNIEATPSSNPATTIDASNIAQPQIIPADQGDINAQSGQTDSPAETPETTTQDPALNQ